MPGRVNLPALGLNYITQMSSSMVIPQVDVYRVRNHNIQRGTMTKHWTLPPGSQDYFSADPAAAENAPAPSFAPPDHHHLAAVQQLIGDDQSLAVNHGFTVPTDYQNIDQSIFDKVDLLSGVQLGLWAQSANWRPECTKDDVPGGEQEKAPWVKYIRDSMLDFSRMEDKLTPKAIRDNGVLNGSIPVEHFQHAAKDVVEASVLLHMYGRQKRGFSDPTVEKDGTIDHKERNLTFTQRMKAICTLFKCSKKAVLDAIKQDLELEYSCVMAPNTTLRLKRNYAASNDKRPRVEAKTKEQSEATEQLKGQDTAGDATKSKPSKTRKHSKAVDTVDDYEGDDDSEYGEPPTKRIRGGARATKGKHSKTQITKPVASISGRKA